MIHLIQKHNVPHNPAPKSTQTPPFLYRTSLNSAPKRILRSVCIESNAMP